MQQVHRDVTSFGVVSVPSAAEELLLHVVMKNVAVVGCCRVAFAVVLVHMGPVPRAQFGALLFRGSEVCVCGCCDDQAEQTYDDVMSQLRLPVAAGDVERASVNAKAAARKALERRVPESVRARAWDELVQSLEARLLSLQRRNERASSAACAAAWQAFHEAADPLRRTARSWDMFERECRSLRAAHLAAAVGPSAKQLGDRLQAWFTDARREVQLREQARLAEEKAR
jgi:hypothetical protein